MVYIYNKLQIHVWLYGIGYLVVYGPILAKMWRVYQIFHNPTPGKKVCAYHKWHCYNISAILFQILKTWHLLCVVGVICCLGVLLILAKTVAQAITTPQLVPDSEELSGTTVGVMMKWACIGMSML